MAKNVYKRIGEGLVRDVNSQTIYTRFRFKGKLIRQSLGTPDKVAARNKLIELKRDLESEPVSPQALENGTIAQSIPHYLTSLENLSRSARGRANDTMARFGEEFGARFPKEIKPMEIQAFLSEFREEREFGADRWNKHIGTLRSYFDFLIKNQLTKANPVTGIKLLKPKPAHRNTPTKEEVKAILARLEKDIPWERESITFIEFMALTGQGKAEINNFRWHDVNWKTNTLSFYRQKTRANAHTMPISAPVQKLLQDKWNKSEKQRDGLVFQVKDVRKMLGTVCKKLGYAPYCHHAFRRYFITECAMNNYPIKLVAKWVGHTTTEMVNEIYTQVPNSYEVEYASKMTGVRA